MWFCLFAFALRDAVAGEAPNVATSIQHGFVQCGFGKKPPPVLAYDHPCNPKPVAELRCREPVEVLSREGPWLMIKSADGTERYVGVSSVSSKKENFVVIDLAASANPYMPDCSAVRPPTHRPIAYYQPDPEYPAEGRKSKISGSVELSITVGTDGKVHKAEVTKSLGHGFDEQALLAVQQWRFEPAAQDGKPVEAQISIKVTFTLY